MTTVLTRRLLLCALLLAGCRSPAGGARLAAGDGDTPSDRTLRVMTWNIAAGHGDLNAIVRAIRETDADVIALQEVDVHWDARSSFADQATALAAALAMQVRFAPIYHVANADSTRPAREFGVALLSRYPVVAFANRSLTRLSTQQAGAAPTPAPGLLDATLDVRGTRVRVLDTHLDYRADPRVRTQQVTETLALLAGETGPTVLMGDLNAPPDAPELAPLFTRFRDAWRETGTGAGLTYPASVPVKRIDYVLVSGPVRVTGARVVESAASDHRAVVVELGIRSGFDGGR